MRNILFASALLGLAVLPGAAIADSLGRPCTDKSEGGYLSLEALEPSHGPFTAPARKAGAVLCRSINRGLSSMPATPHVEKHFTASESVRDVVIGMADGLTVPFALAAGLSAAVSSTSIIVTAGLAEIAAGAIAMGLGGFLAARGDVHHYDAEVARERYEIEHLRDREVAEVRHIFAGFGLAGEALDKVVEGVTSDKNRWTDFMMRFELGLEKPDPKRAPISAATIAVAYLVGGLVPLLPYMFAPTMEAAFRWSVAATAVTLLIFGAVKGRFAGLNPLVSALQTLLVGGLAAAAAYWLAHLFG